MSRWKKDMGFVSFPYGACRRSEANGRWSLRPTKWETLGPWRKRAPVWQTLERPACWIMQGEKVCSQGTSGCKPTSKSTKSDMLMKEPASHRSKRAGTRPINWHCRTNSLYWKRKRWWAETRTGNPAVGQWSWAPWNPWWCSASKSRTKPSLVSGSFYIGKDSHTFLFLFFYVILCFFVIRHLECPIFFHTTRGKLCAKNDSHIWTTSSLFPRLNSVIFVVSGIRPPLTKLPQKHAACNWISIWTRRGKCQT